jgi:hypothetical protein
VLKTIRVEVWYATDKYGVNRRALLFFDVSGLHGAHIQRRERLERKKNQLWRRLRQKLRWPQRLLLRAQTGLVNNSIRRVCDKQKQLLLDHLYGVLRQKMYVGDLHPEDPHGWLVQEEADLLYRFVRHSEIDEIIDLIDVASRMEFDVSSHSLYALMNKENILLFRSAS